MILQYLPTKRAPIFQETKNEDWNNWIWQMQQSLTNLEEFEKVFELSEEEKAGLKESGKLFKVSTTPYYASLGIGSEPLRRIMVPRGPETELGAQQMLDPLDENNHSPSPRIVHRYSDRVLFLITDTCSVYCRFCTRKRFTGQEEGMAQGLEYNDAIKYIQNHPGIREVIFSGGDPLTLSNNVLDRVLSDVRKIPHVEIIRIGTRMPVVCPMRIDVELCKILKKNNPVYMMTHFSHPKELTREAFRAITMIADNGIPLFNQMVLLNGVNNHPAIVQALSRRLLYARVKPYYMFQCDPSEGTDHLRTTVESSEALVRELWGHLSGLAMPTLSLDIPSGGGKTTLAPNFLVKNQNGSREFKGWDGKLGVYTNPKTEMITPNDSSQYEVEWTDLKRARDEQI